MSVENPQRAVRFRRQFEPFSTLYGPMSVENDRARLLEAGALQLSVPSTGQ